MVGVEKVLDDNKMIALILRNKVKVNNLKFFTSDESDLQVGIHNRKKGMKLIPHVHTIKKRLQVKSIQEALYIATGKVRISLYTHNGNLITNKILKKGDSVLFVSGGHGVDFLQNTRIFQVKQGPFSSTIHSKIYLRNSSNDSSK